MTTTVLGKRKLRTPSSKPSIPEEDAQAIFRRHFEAQFKPLPPTVRAAPSEPEEALDDDDDDDDDEEEEDDEGEELEDEWPGVSDDDDNNETPDGQEIETVDHSARLVPAIPSSALSKRESKAYLSSRPPPSTSLSLTPTNDTSGAARRKKGGAGKEDADGEDSAALLKNDLALQRLLSESHLFSSSSTLPAAAAGGVGATSTSSPSSSIMTHTGRNRHKATDLRLSSLGAKASIYKQANMPMSHRKGIEAAAAQREAKRRREAKENGIVLERLGGGSKKSRAERPRRDRAVDLPAVGKLRDGMLKLSRKDVREIQGPPGGGRMGKMKRRRR